MKKHVKYLSGKDLVTLHDNTTSKEERRDVINEMRRRDRRNNRK